jgi:ABC-type sulfate transport system permease component
VLFVFMLLVPLLVIIVFSFGERAPAGGYQAGFTLENYANLPARGKAFLNTLTLAPLGTLLTAIIAFPMAYFLAVKCDPKWRVALLVLVMAPFWTSQLLRYYAWIMLLGAKGIPSWLGVLGFPDFRIINTPWAVLIGAVYGFLPLMVPPIYVSLEKLDKRLLEASADLGATPVRTFFQVTLPDGRVAYTRNGAMHLSAEGLLVNADGYALEPQISIPPNATSVTISKRLFGRTEIQPCGSATSSRASSTSATAPSSAMTCLVDRMCRAFERRLFRSSCGSRMARTMP